MYAFSVESLNNTGGGDGLEVVRIESFKNVRLPGRKKPLSGQYTYKIYHMARFLYNFVIIDKSFIKSWLYLCCIIIITVKRRLLSGCSCLKGLWNSTKSLGMLIHIAKLSLRLVNEIAVGLKRIFKNLDFSCFFLLKFSSIIFSYLEC